MVKPVHPNPKKSYATPRLSVYGTIETLTRVNKTQGTLDGRGSGSQKFYTTPGA